MVHALTRGLGFLAFVGAASAAEPVAAPAEPKPLMARLNPFSSSTKPSEPAPPPQPKSPAVGPTVSKPVVGPLSPESLLAVIQDEQQAYFRRLEVCVQLRIVASNTNDEKLSSQADELERMAELTYKTRIARLGVKSNLRTNAGAEDLDRTIGSRMNSTPLTSGVQSPADVRPATAQLRNFREVKP